MKDAALQQAFYICQKLYRSILREEPSSTCCYIEHEDNGLIIYIPPMFSKLIAIAKKTIINHYYVD